jgi:hypothetical protein
MLMSITFFVFDLLLSFSAWPSSILTSLVSMCSVQAADFHLVPSFYSMMKARVMAMLANSHDCRLIRIFRIPARLSQLVFVDVQCPD